MATVEVAGAQSTRWTAARIGGVAGLGFAAGVILQNGVLLAGSPVPGAPLDDVIRFYSDNSTRILIAAGWVAINAAFLLTFISVVTARMADSPETSLWGRIAYAGGIALLPIFASAAYMQIVLVSRIEELAVNLPVLSLLKELHSGAFSMSFIALGITLGALSLGAIPGRLVPTWTAYLGLAGSAFLFIAGAFAFNVINGGPALFIGFAGFAIWVVWLIAASLRLLRSDE